MGSSSLSQTPSALKSSALLVVVSIRMRLCLPTSICAIQLRTRSTPGESCSGYVTLGPMQREAGSRTKDDFENSADETHRGHSKRSSNAAGVLRNQFPALCDELLACQRLHRRRQSLEPKTRLGSSCRSHLLSHLSVCTNSLICRAILWRGCFLPSVHRFEQDTRVPAKKHRNAEKKRHEKRSIASCASLAV